jgi:hypothetical protein
MWKKNFLVGQIFLGQVGPKNLAKSWQQLIAQGRLLKEVCNDPRIKGVWLEVNNAGKTARNHQLLPKMVLENIWAERFLVDYVQLPSGALAAHANQI